MRPSVAKLLLIVVVLLASDPAFAINGEVTHLSGAVVARRSEGGSRILTMKSQVAEGDIVITSDSSYARIKWTDGGEVVLRPNTQLKIDAYKYEEGNPQGDNIVMSLIKGGLRSVTGLLGKRSPNGFRVATPNATIGIRGTGFGLLVCNDDCSNIPGGPPNGLHVDVSDGIIIVTNQAGSLEFRIGQFGYVQNFNSLPVQIPAAQGIRVTLPQQSLNQNIQGGSVGKSGDLECKIN